MTLAGQRPAGLGTSPIPMSEILAYQHLTGTTISPFMLDCIRVADQALMAEMAKRRGD